MKVWKKKSPSLKERELVSQSFFLMWITLKNVNDTYGHNVGDEVLKRLSQSLKDQVRNYDDVGRWGGEEL